MKLKFENAGYTQPDPFILEDGDKFYIYATSIDGAKLYSSDSVTGPYKYEGIVCTVDGFIDCWAPCVIKIDKKYYMYFSVEREEKPRTYAQRLFVAESDSPLGPFVNPKQLYDYFSIDAHVVKTEAGLFLWYAVDIDEPGMDKVGTRVCLDRLIDPYTPANEMKQVILPSFPEERSKTKEENGYEWYTLEGPFWFEQDGWQYVMFSGACFENDSYHLNYAAAKTDEQDLMKVDYVKHSLNGKFDPLLIKNDTEEGTGHHSLIKINGQYYVIYHGRDLDAPKSGEQRTARIAKLHVNDGVLTIERM